MKSLLLVASAFLVLAAAEESSLSTESQLQQKLDAHIAGVERQLKVLDHLLNTYYKDYNYTEEDAHEYVSNPINTYMLIKRTALEWPAVKQVVFDPEMDKQFEEIQELAKKLEAEKKTEL